MARRQMHQDVERLRNSMARPVQRAVGMWGCCFCGHHPRTNCPLKLVPVACSLWIQVEFLYVWRGIEVLLVF